MQGFYNDGTFGRQDFADDAHPLLTSGEHRLHTTSESLPSNPAHASFEDGITLLGGSARHNREQLYPHASELQASPDADFLAFLDDDPAGTTCAELGDTAFEPPLESSLKGERRSARLRSVTKKRHADQPAAVEENPRLAKRQLTSASAYVDFPNISKSERDFSTNRLAPQRHRLQTKTMKSDLQETVAAQTEALRAKDAEIAELKNKHVSESIDFRRQLHIEYMMFFGANAAAHKQAIQAKDAEIAELKNRYFSASADFRRQHHEDYMTIFDLQQKVAFLKGKLGWR